MGGPARRSSWGLVVLCSSLRPINEWSISREGAVMAQWHSNIRTKREFASQVKHSPELIFIDGVWSGRRTLQSLPTVMDEFFEIYVRNRSTPRSAVVRRHGRGFVVCWLKIRTREHWELT